MKPKSHLCNSLLFFDPAEGFERVTCHWECDCIFLRVCAARFPSRAPLRAMKAYLQSHLTGLGWCSMKNISKPLVGVKTSRASFHTLTTWAAQQGCCLISTVKSAALTKYDYSFTPINAGVCAQREMHWVSHPSPSGLHLYTDGSTRSVRCSMRPRGCC